MIAISPDPAAEGRETADDSAPTASQLAEARQLLREAPLIDGHNDLPWQYRKLGDDIHAINLRENTAKLPSPLVTDIPRLRAGGVGGQFWSVYVPATLTNGAAIEAVLQQIDITHQIIAQYPDTFELALTAADVVRIHHSGKIASLVGMEGGHSIGDSLAVLRMMYRLGARYMTLTHTKNTSWADSANDTPVHHGLSPFGEEVVREMNRLGMMVDLSHVSPDTMRAAIKVSRAPVIFSHSCARALCDDPRDVPDDVLRLVKADQGIVMVTFFPQFLTEPARHHYELKTREHTRLEALYGGDTNRINFALEDWQKRNPQAQPTSIKDVADHVDHVRKVAGIDCVGLGGDYEGFHGPPLGMEDVSCYPALLAELLRRGYSAEDIKKVAGLNILRVMRQVETVAAEMQRAGK